jgi:translation initiation factor IF-3
MGMKDNFNYRINKQIRTNSVRVIGDNFDKTGQIFELQKALDIACDMGVDLVEISPSANPPVCKLIDYNKYIYELKKKQKDNDKKQKENTQEIKELKFGPNIDDHDYNFKLVHAKNFLDRGDIVKATILFKGREINFKQKGEIILLQLASDLSDVGVPDNVTPKLEGKKMIMIIKPKKKK